MEGFQFIDIIILAMVAGFIVLRLRSVLGRRTGHDPRDNREPTRDGVAPDAFGRKDRGSDNVVSLPGARRTRDGSDIEPAYQNTPLEPGLVQIKLADPSFSATRFLEGASKAFEMIVTAFARHDIDTLRPLLSTEVFGRFAAAIQDREERGETMETELVVLKPAKLESAEMQGSRAVLSVRFQSEQVNVIKDKDGKIIDGDKDHVDSLTDIWTFARDTTHRDPNWQLIATRSVE
jgi:predicted lipid-binding transport protein (Tim44 family)